MTTQRNSIPSPDQTPAASLSTPRTPGIGDAMMRSIARELSPKWLIVYVAGLMTAWFTMSSRVTIVEQNVPHLAEQVAANQAAITKLQTDSVPWVYFNTSLQNIELRLTSIDGELQINARSKP